MLSAEGGLIGLKELIAKPGLVMGLLKSVVNILKTRFPMLLGANAALSMALFGMLGSCAPLCGGNSNIDAVVLLVLWYCYKRGKEVRLEKEKEEAEEMAALLGGPSTPEKVAQTAAASNGVEADLAGGSKC